VAIAVGAALLAIAAGVSHWFSISSPPSHSDLSVSEKQKESPQSDEAAPSDLGSVAPAGPSRPVDANARPSLQSVNDEKSFESAVAHLKASLNWLDAALHPRATTDFGKPRMVLDVESRLQAMEHELNQTQR
jgi:hypothetical protein